MGVGAQDRRAVVARINRAVVCHIIYDFCRSRGSLRFCGCILEFNIGGFLSFWNKRRERGDSIDEDDEAKTKMKKSK